MQGRVWAQAGRCMPSAPGCCAGTTLTCSLQAGQRVALHDARGTANHHQVAVCTDGAHRVWGGARRWLPAVQTALHSQAALFAALQLVSHDEAMWQPVQVLVPQLKTQHGAHNIVDFAVTGHCSTCSGPGRPCSTQQQPAHASGIMPGVHDRVQRALTAKQAGKVLQASLARQAHMGNTLVNVEDGFGRAFLWAWVCRVSAAWASLASCRVHTGDGHHQERCRKFLDTP